MTIQPERVIHVDFALVSVALLFVCLRLYVRIAVIRKFSSADVLVVIAWFCYLGDCFVDWFTHKCGMWDSRLKFKADGTIPDYNGVIKDHNKLKHGLIVMYALQPLYVIELYSIKAAFLMLYHELFPVSMVKLRRAMYVAFGLVILGLLSITGLNIFWCFPIHRNWTMDPEQRCLAWAAIKPYYYSASLNISTDLLVYALPFFLLPTLRFASRKKILGLVFIFSLGLFCIACTISRILMSDTTTDTATTGLWYSVEQFCSITVVCCPPLKILWTYERNIHHASASPPSDRLSWERRYINVIGHWGRKILPSFSTATQRSGASGISVDVEKGNGRNNNSNATDTSIGEWTVDGGTVDAGTTRILVNGTVVGGLAPRQKKVESVRVVERPQSLASISNVEAEGEDLNPTPAPSNTAKEEDGSATSPPTRPGFWRKISIKLDTSVSQTPTFGSSNASASASATRSFSFSRSPQSAVASYSQSPVRINPRQSSSTSAIAGSVYDETVPPTLYTLTKGNERGSFKNGQPTARLSAGNLSAVGGIGTSTPVTAVRDRERESTYTTSSHGADSAGDDVRGSFGR